MKLLLPHRWVESVQNIRGPRLQRLNRAPGDRASAESLPRVSKRSSQDVVCIETNLHRELDLAPQGRRSHRWDLKPVTGTRNAVLRPGCSTVGRSGQIMRRGTECARTFEIKVAWSSPYGISWTKVEGSPMHDRYHVTRNTSLNCPGMCTKTDLGNTQARSLPQK